MPKNFFHLIICNDVTVISKDPKLFGVCMMREVTKDMVSSPVRLNMVNIMAITNTLTKVCQAFCLLTTIF